jgi:hypothetical protein
VNRSEDFKILGENPEAAGQLAKAIRKGIVKGFFAVKKAKLCAEEIKKLYKIPDCYGEPIEMPDGSLLWSFCDSSIKVTDDGEARESHMGLNNSGHYFTDSEWDPK